ncbi:unnamed protein product [Soboliphyme baturini]|uniref:Uncharacterized protein n=1 Tax=Soboliphyme baturini TaxID=241478 RepID=A0A183ISF1_9BILA|nr:unnamed protein product [Soboliphyme baturini]
MRKRIFPNDPNNNDRLTAGQRRISRCPALFLFGVQYVDGVVQLSDSVRGVLILTESACSTASGRSLQEKEPKSEYHRQSNY